VVEEKGILGCQGGSEIYISRARSGIADKYIVEGSGKRKGIPKVKSGHRKGKTETERLDATMA